MLFFQSIFGSNELKWIKIFNSFQSIFVYCALRVLQIAFHPYCSPNVKQEQNAICSTCDE